MGSGTNRDVQALDRSTPFTPTVVAAVAVGGSIGASGRWFVSWLIDGGDAHVAGTWPWATLLVNVVGCLVIGFAARTLERDSTRWAFVVTGVLGGFTTFSAFAVELNDLAEADRMTLAIIYGAVTLAAGIAATVVAEVGQNRP